jgi:phospholipid/cholesterol/gamma-HCH transport system substrate-binding protein
MAKHRNPVFKPLIKFSIYTVVCLALLFGLAARVGNLTPPTHKRDFYTAVLSNADSLVGKDDVKIAGVTVGQVHSVRVHQGKAIVRFSVDHNIRLRTGTAAGLRWQDIIGDKFLYLYPSTSGAVLPRGAQLTDEVQGADVGDFLIDIGGFLHALNPNDINKFTAAIVGSLQDNQGQVSQLLDNTATLSQNLAGQDSNIAQIVDNLTSTLTALEARDGDLAQVIDHLSSVAANLSTRNDVIDNVIANFTQVNGLLSQLVDNNGANVDQITSSLQTIATVLKQHTADLDAGLTTASAGLAPYIEISKLGQWFAIRVVYTCLANEKSCSYDQPSNPPKTLDNPPLNPVPGSVAGTLPQSGAEGATASPASAASSQGARAGSSAATPASPDPGARPIGPATPAPTVGTIIDFALYGDGSS